MSKNENEENPMSCTVPPLAPRLKMSFVTMPSHLHNALKNIYYKKEFTIKNTSSSLDLHKTYNYVKCIESFSNIQTITKQVYLTVLKICLYLIQFEEDFEMKRYKLTNHAVKIHATKDHFIINMDILKTDLCLITSHDFVTLKDTTSKWATRAKIVEVLGNNVIIKVQYTRDAEVLKNATKRFNIDFWTDHWSLNCCHYALAIISRCNWIEIVYPQLKTDCIDMKINIEWINTNMKENERQKQAVRKILNKTARPAPYIIFGPPGTGKTATLVEAICQIVRHFPTKSILVCTVSNAAADEITKRLIHMEHIPRNLIYRMYAPSREWVDKEIEPCANFVEGNTVLLGKELLLMKKIVITTLTSSTRLIDLNFRKDHFSYVIIDEASQATEPEMLIPFALTNKKSNDEEGTGFQAQIVIAGDPYQLGPIVRCRRIEHLLGKSMLERLMSDCEPYKKQNGEYNPNYITKLVQNYRSHESILFVSNKLFYNDLRICGGTDTRMALNWSQLPNKNFPIIFQEVRGIEERASNKSVSNMAEILAVLMYVDILMNTTFGKYKIIQKDIGIVTPFKQQQLDISNYLAAMKLKDITVGTVETFQGQERNVMILTTVRSQIFEHKNKEHIGFLSNPKRFNVAITRAKALMIIIGNPEILCTDKHWDKLWKYCKKHNACIPFEQLPLRENIITKLESNSKIKSCNGNYISDAVELSENSEEEESETKTFDRLVHKMENLKLKQK